MKAFLLCCLLCPCACAKTFGQDAQALVRQAIAAVGGRDALYALQDVEYRYHRGGYVSLERYIFDGEISYGKTVLEDGAVREQYLNGNRVIVLLDGQRTRDSQEVKAALFRRKTNFYWLTMVQKLGDPGVQLEYAGVREVQGIPYELVNVTFAEGVGVARDRYLLYINPYTHLVDRFLFTVAAVNRTTPILMLYTYGTFRGGVRFPVVSQSHPATDWEGSLDEAGEWSVSYRNHFRFGTDFTAENIRK